MSSDPIVIVSATRTPIGNFQGCLSNVTAAELGSVAIRGAIDKAEIDPQSIQEVIMGCVLPAGQGQAPARQASLGAGLPESANCTTINKMCGSGLKAVMLAHDLLIANSNQVMVAGGMESMTNAPYILPNARQGYRMGHHQVQDHMFLDGLEDAYDKGKLMGVFADQTAKKYKFSREIQDEFAIRSLERAKHAQTNGHFKNEIIPVEVKTRKETLTITDDEGPKTARPDKIPQLKPAFAKEGTVTAANASSISDGASALILMRESVAKAHNLTPIARILGHASHAQAPSWFTTAPVGAIQSLLNKVQWASYDVDLYEINEAFAVVTLAAMHDLELNPEQVNIYGGACALGHPIGASGARILTTLIHALHMQQKNRGIASLCIGGGEATAIAIERC